MKYRIKPAALLAASFSLTSPLSAQSYNPALDLQQRETRISAAITIPLGHSSDRRQTAPRVEIITRSRAPDGFSPIIARAEEQRWQERRIGLTLDGSKALMINGRPMPAQDQQDGISTVAGIAIGVGVVALVSAALLLDGITDLGDDD